MARCYIGVGSNLATPLEQARQAVQHIAEIDKVSVVSSSSLYGSRPMGPQDQPDYINAVVAIDTTLDAIALLDELQRIELEHGRERKEQRWGARTLDLDILLYANDVINHERLTVPHYGMKQREFVLYPLAEIAPDLVLPDQSQLSELLASVPLNGLERIESLNTNC